MEAMVSYIFINTQLFLLAVKKRVFTFMINGMVHQSDQELSAGQLDHRLNTQEITFGLLLRIFAILYEKFISKSKLHTLRRGSLSTAEVYM